METRSQSFFHNCYQQCDKGKGFKQTEKKRLKRQLMARERFELYIPIISRVECKATSRQVRESNRILSKTYNLVAGVMGFLIY